MRAGWIARCVPRGRMRIPERARAALLPSRVRRTRWRRRDAVRRIGRPASPASGAGNASAARAHRLARLVGRVRLVRSATLDRSAGKLRRARARGRAPRNAGCTSHRGARRARCFASRSSRSTRCWRRLAWPPCRSRSSSIDTNQFRLIDRTFSAEAPIANETPAATAVAMGKALDEAVEAVAGAVERGCNDDESWLRTALKPSYASGGVDLDPRDGPLHLVDEGPEAMQCTPDRLVALLLAPSAVGRDRDLDRDRVTRGGQRDLVHRPSSLASGRAKLATRLSEGSG